MSFHVTVQGGEDDGKSFRVEGQCVIGRAPRCTIRLSAPEVAWEHAALQDLATLTNDLDQRRWAGDDAKLDGARVEKVAEALMTEGL